jgi:small-conductance mechanosensitive channel
MVHFLGDWPAWSRSLVILTGALLLTLAAEYVVFSLLGKIVRRTGSRIHESVLRHGKKPAMFILPFLTTVTVLPALPLPQSLWGFLNHTAGIGLIGSIAWLVVALIAVFTEVVSFRYSIEDRDNLMARKIQTQIHMLRRIAEVVVVVIAISLMLMTFPGIAHLGATVFASAGVAGLVVGIAARPALSNLIAGIQIALTEPIRIDDVVIVGGEWGRIEEIGTTYVVVRIWDLRRLVVPLSQFIEQPFQNWTRVTADLLGTVYLYADYTVPVEAVRQELRRILESTALWDKKICVLQVTNATEHAMEMRALMSAPDSGTAWDLRCYVREKLIDFLQQRYPQCLPRARADIRGTPDDNRSNQP